MIRRKHILIGVIAFAVVLSSGAIAFAATDTTSSLAGKERPAMMTSLTDEQREAVQQIRVESREEAIAELVDSGIITQEEADKMTEGRGIQKGNCDNDSLTAEQRTTQRIALQDALKAKLEVKLAELVDEGILTQELADELLNHRGGLRMGPGGKHGNGFGGRPGTGEPPAEAAGTEL